MCRSDFVMPTRVFLAAVVFGSSSEVFAFNGVKIVNIGEPCPRANCALRRLDVSSSATCGAFTTRIQTGRKGLENNFQSLRLHRPFGRRTRPPVQTSVYACVKQSCLMPSCAQRIFASSIGSSPADNEKEKGETRRALEPCLRYTHNLMTPTAGKDAESFERTAADLQAAESASVDAKKVRLTETRGAAPRRAAPRRSELC